ncbi:DUF1738 domain-containing protein [Nostoc ellipsosporum NOK]|nr:DUF1738 domain-containing protein [Nostoc ellipsosporum NOK]
MEHVATSAKEAVARISRKDLHQEITNTIISQLEAGTVPWQQPWINGNLTPLKLPLNAISSNRYRGINIVLLWNSAINNGYDSHEWASFKQWQSQKEQIRKGEKGNLIVYYDTFEKEVDGEVKIIPFLKSSFVFNRCQLNSYKPDTQHDDKPKETLVERLEHVDRFVDALNVPVYHKHDRAFYSSSKDFIQLPPIDTFCNTDECTATEGYYSTLLHEVVHATGHSSRLNRKFGKKFGDKLYAEEELTAELGSAFLAAEHEIRNPTTRHDANYIASWLKVLRDNKHCIFAAASEASKAVDYLYKLQPSN